MDLIHPGSKADVMEALRAASAEGRRVLPVGGRRHIDKGNPCEVDAELWTTQLDRIVTHEPADMIAVVEAGMRFGDLDAALERHAQEWPADAPADATVGGIIASATSSPRRLKVGALRDGVLEVEFATGDGRLIRGGARTVKNVAGYDLPRLAAGSLGTLGVIVQVALKLRPRPRARRTLVTEGSLDLARRLLAVVPSPAAVLALPGRVHLRLEGWPEEVREQTDAALRVTRAFEARDEEAFPSDRPWDDSPVVAEAAVPPSGIPRSLEAAGDAWGALFGVGLVWAGLASADGPLSALRASAAELGGIAPVIRGPGGLGAQPAALEVHERLKRSFDPANVLAPGRSWGGL